MLFCSAPLNTSADSYGVFQWTYTDDGAVINGVDGTVSGIVTFPSSIDGYPVVGIGKDAFKNCTSLTGVAFPESLKKIEQGAFYGCTGLTEVNIPSCVTSIGKEAFENCTALTDVAFPESLKTIEQEAFYGCTGLTEVNIPSCVTSIGLDAFGYCSSIESLTVSESNTVFYSENNCVISKTDAPLCPESTAVFPAKTLFLGCKNSVIPADGKVETIGPFAFLGCSGLTEIIIPEGVTGFSNYDPVRLSHAFKDCTGLRNVVLPDSLTNLGVNAFRNCTSLTEITIPENMKIIKGGAFEDCSNLETVHYYAKDLTSVSEDLYSTGFWLNGCYSLKKLFIENTVRKIPPYLFANCGSVQEITIYNTVESLEYSSFSSCSRFSKLFFKGTPEEWMENYNRYFSSSAYVREIYYQGGICTKTDAPSNISIEFEYGTFGTPNDSELNLIVENIAEYEPKFSSFKAYVNGVPVALYEIHMKNSGSLNMQPVDEKEVTVKIPVPANLDPSLYNSVFVFHRKQDGTTERLKYITGDLVIEDGFFVFNVDSFSDFAVCTDDNGNHIDMDGDHICDLCAADLSYKVKLIFDGENLGDITYYYNDNYIENLPDVPSKEGYTGKWVYSVQGSELSIKPEYTPIVYYATFIADGRQIGNKIPFTVEDKSLNEPAVPQKEGYTGKWNDYTLGAGDITVTAHYTKTVNPAATVTINVAGKARFSFGTKLIIKATADNLEPGYRLVMVINEKEVTGNNKEVVCEYGELKSDVDYYVKIVDANGNALKDSDGKEVRKDGGTITCKAGFLQRLFAVLLRLLGMLPEKTVKP